MLRTRLELIASLLNVMFRSRRPTIKNNEDWSECNDNFLRDKTLPRMNLFSRLCRLSPWLLSVPILALSGELYIVISAEVQTQIHAITYSFQFKPSPSLHVPPEGMMFKIMVWCLKLFTVFMFTFWWFLLICQ